MRADYFKTELQEARERSLACIKNWMPDIAKIKYMPSLQEAKAHALRLARKQTKRTHILILADPLQAEVGQDKNDDLTVIPAGNAARLCEAIAISAERLAAIVVSYQQASPFYYKKVRELSSAEGAVMIWNALDSPLNQADTRINLSKNSQPDLICFILDKAVWLGGKREMTSEL
jgi:glutamate-1-semialdehyde aminotransferase